MDIGAPTGTPVYGTVITSRYYGAYGNHIMMKHTVNGLSYTTVYAQPFRVCWANDCQRHKDRNDWCNR
nr:M23 family metallopeptidase [Exiguobacterium antarcticum]